MGVVRVTVTSSCVCVYLFKCLHEDHKLASHCIHGDQQSMWGLNPGFHEFEGMLKILYLCYGYN